MRLTPSHTGIPTKKKKPLIDITNSILICMMEGKTLG